MNDNNIGTIEYYDMDNVGIYDNYNDYSASEETLVTDSGNNVDYSGYFDNIVNNLESINEEVVKSNETVVEVDENAITLDIIHNDLQIVILLFLVYMTIFVGHGFVNRFRNL